jgi:hypothetical protein
MLLQIREGRVKNVTCAAAGQMLKVSFAVESYQSRVIVMFATHGAACMYAVVRITCHPTNKVFGKALNLIQCHGC